jgi:hypothetical protein
VGEYVSEAQSWRGYWLLQAHIAWFGEREWHAAAERVSRYGVSTAPRVRAGTQAIVRVSS